MAGSIIFLFFTVILKLRLVLFHIFLTVNKSHEKTDNFPTFPPGLRLSEH